MPVGLLLPLCGNTLQNERFREQLKASIPLCKQLWQQTVQSKINNQAALVKLKSGHPAKNLIKWSKEVKSGDSENMEARAAAYYWKNIFSDLPDFKRDRDGNPPNNLLNYGYAILRAIVARSLLCAGLLPTLGIHHHNRYNAYCLADDIMEPYRPYVDKIVLEILDLHSSDIELSKDVKFKLLGISLIEVIINNERSPLMIAAQKTANSLYKCFSGTQRKITYPEM
jgi:CRISPR-associated protein Cas1